MEREQIAGLLEKYWQAETTVEEEQILAEYFRGTDVPLEWEPYREIFSFYDQEKEVQPGAGLEERILERIRPRREVHGAWWAAAAVIVLGLGVSLWEKNTPVMRDMTVERGRAMDSDMPGERSTASVAMKDTYDDPREALAAVQKALLVASRNMNKGLHPLK